MRAGVGLAEQQHLGVWFRQGLAHARIAHAGQVVLGQDHAAGRRPQAGDRRDRQPQHRPQVQLKFAQVLAHQRHQAGVVGPRRKF